MVTTTMQQAMDALGAYIEPMGGGNTAWWINLGQPESDEPAPAYALITDDSGCDHDGDPNAATWMVGRYVEAELGEAAELHCDKTFSEAVAIVRGWVEAAK